MEGKRALSLAPWTILALAVLLSRSDDVERRGARASVAPFAPEQHGVVRVAIRDNAYVPARIEVDRGTTVVWTDEDPLQHTVTATNRSWDSGPIAKGGTYRRRFDRPGIYSYFCLPHPNMTGVVVVRSGD
jgi:plastocyanin